MQVVYAHYSKPYGGSLRGAKTHWAIPYMECLVLAYSAYKSKEFFGSTKFVCDEYGKQLFIDVLGIKFDEVSVDLDGCEKYPMWWAAGKIHAYTKSVKRFSPFIMCDNDAGFHERPASHYFESRYRCQSIHHDAGTIFEGLVRRIVRETKNEYPYDIYHDAIKNVDGIKGGNAGMIVMGDEQLFNEFTRYTWDLMESSFMQKVASEGGSNKYNHMNYWNVVVEEILMLQLYRRIRGELPQTFFEFNGLTPPNGVRNPSNYFHIWGKKRDINKLREFEQKAVAYLPKELTNRIYEYFK